MFGKKQKPSIDKEQLELMKTAQERIKQKKRLYYHFVLFLAGAIALIIANVVVGYAEDVQPLGIDWFVWAIGLWSLILVYHLFTVFVTNKFMGKAWEAQQLEKLMAKQEARIEKLKNNLKNEELLMAEAELAQEKEESKKIAAQPTQKEQCVTIIAAVAENNVIGKNNELIWHLSDDLKHFKSLTNGHHVIMGRKTFQSMPKALPNRTNVVISRQPDFTAENITVVRSLEEALKVAKDDPQPFVIGGGEIYKEALQYADRIELTRVHHEFEGDTFFPEINLQRWKEVDATFHPKDEKHAYDFTFQRFELR